MADFITCPEDGNTFELVVILDGPNISTIGNSIFSIYSSAQTAVNINIPLEAQRVNIINLNPVNSLLAQWATTQLFTEMLDQYGNNILFSPVLTWTSSDPLIATVNQSGLVTGISAGEATITATTGTSSGSALVTVSGMPISL